VEGDYGPAAQGAASFHTTRWTIEASSETFSAVGKEYGPVLMNGAIAAGGKDGKRFLLFGWRLFHHLFQ